MAVALTEMEGTWEEILEHASEFEGRRLRVTVLGDAKVAFAESPEERQKNLLAWLDELQREPLPEEELRALDEFEQFRKEHPFRLRRLDQDE